MEKSVNLRVEDFKNDLYSLVNNSGLPISVVYYVFNTVGRDLSDEYGRVLNQERQQLAAATEVKTEE